MRWKPIHSYAAGAAVLGAGLAYLLTRPKKQQTFAFSEGYTLIPGTSIVGPGDGASPAAVADDPEMQRLIDESNAAIAAAGGPP